MIKPGKVASSEIETSELINVTSKAAAEASNNNVVNNLLSKVDSKENEIKELNNDVLNLVKENINKDCEIIDLKKNGKKVYIYKNDSNYSINPLCGGSLLMTEGDEAIAKIRAEVEEELNKKYKTELAELEGLKVSHEEEINTNNNAHIRIVNKLNAKIEKLEIDNISTKTAEELRTIRREILHNEDTMGIEKNYNFWKLKADKKYNELKERYESLKDKGVETSILKEVEFYRGKVNSFLGLFMPKYNPA